MNIVDVANSYKFTVEGDANHKKLIDEYNAHRPAGSYQMTYTDPWCAAFVSVCAYKAGVKAPYACNTETLKAGMKITNTPKTGYFAFFDWDGDGVTDHVGIVTGVDYGKIVNVVSGNYSDKVSYTIHNLNEIACYGVIESGTNEDVEDDGLYNSDELFYPVLQLGEKNVFVKVCQALLAARNFDVEVDGEFGQQTESQLIMFQKQSGGPATGKCDKYTWPSLLKGKYGRLKLELQKELGK